MILLSLEKLYRDIVSIFLGTLSRDIILIFKEKSIYQNILFCSSAINIFCFLQR